jgi:hypothetical protein
MEFSERDIWWCLCSYARYCLQKSGGYIDELGWVRTFVVQRTAPLPGCAENPLVIHGCTRQTLFEKEMELLNVLVISRDVSTM